MKSMFTRYKESLVYLIVDWEDGWRDLAQALIDLALVVLGLTIRILLLLLLPLSAYVLAKRDQLHDAESNKPDDLNDL